MENKISTVVIDTRYDPIYTAETRTESRMHQAEQRRQEARKFIMDAAGRFVRRHGILLIGMVALMLWTYGACAITAKATAKAVNERLSAEYSAEYEEKLHAYIAQQEAARAAEATAAAANQPDMELKREADALARLIGPMETRRMKLTMIWNVLMRVDSPYYPNSVTECVDQPSQWMFYSSTNPIRADDWDLAMDQLALWHEGRYPAGLKNTYLYGEWSEGDYVLRDRWDKTDRTVYWRYPEE